MPLGQNIRLHLIQLLQNTLAGLRIFPTSVSQGQLSAGSVQQFYAQPALQSANIFGGHESMNTLYTVPRIMRL